MTITLNGACVEVAEGSTVADIMEGYAGSERIREDAPGVAVAVNGEVVARGRWREVRLSRDDRVEVLAAIGGG